MEAKLSQTENLLIQKVGRLADRTNVALFASTEVRESAIEILQMVPMVLAEKNQQIKELKARVAELEAKLPKESPTTLKKK